MISIARVGGIGLADPASAGQIYKPFKIYIFWHD